MLANVFGGLSGTAIRPIAVRMVWEGYRAVDLPADRHGWHYLRQGRFEFILAGASAVAVGTAKFTNPYASLEVLSGIQRGGPPQRTLPDDRPGSPVAKGAEHR